MILRCSQLFCCSNRSFKEFLLSFPYLSPLWVGHCTAMATRRVEGGYPKYQRWPGALKMRRGDFHESCVAGAGWLLSGAALQHSSSYLSICPPLPRTGSQQQHSSRAGVCCTAAGRNCRQEITEKRLSFEFAFLCL